MVEVTREALRKVLNSKVSLGVIAEAADPDSGSAGPYALADAIADALGLPQDEPEELGTVIRWREWEYIATNSTPGTYRWVWVNPERTQSVAQALRWEDFGSSKVEVVK